MFSQFTVVPARGSGSGSTREGIATTYLDGAPATRGDVIEEFTQGDAPVFLISLKAGGVGLTLTEADYVFVLDPWWNPAVEAQAVDRAHRIGQDKPVIVYRLVADRHHRGEGDGAQGAQGRRCSPRSSTAAAAPARRITADDIRALFD